MPIPDGVYDSFGPVAVLLAVIHDVLSLALVSKRVRSSIPPITEITIGPKFDAYFENLLPLPRLHWYSSFEQAAEPEKKLAVIYSAPIDNRGRLQYLDAHAVIRRMPPALAAGITHLSIDCSLGLDRETGLHLPVMHSYRSGRPDSLANLKHALRQHGAVFTALRGLEIFHSAKGYTGHDGESDVVLGLCARALVKNTRSTLRHLALQTATRFSETDFLHCMFHELQFLNADMTPFIALPYVHDLEEANASFRDSHELLVRNAQTKCPNLERLEVKSIPSLSLWRRDEMIFEL